MTTTLAILYERGPNSALGKPLADQPLREHLDYLLALHKNGKVSMGNPYADEAGVPVILTVDDFAEAELLIVNDPAIATGTLKAKVKAWYCVA